MLIVIAIIIYNLQINLKIKNRTVNKTFQIIIYNNNNLCHLKVKVVIKKLKMKSENKFIYLFYKVN